MESLDYPPPTSRRTTHDAATTEEERTGLLSEDHDEDIERAKEYTRGEKQTVDSSRRTGQIGVLIFFVVLAAFFVPAMFVTTRVPRKQLVHDTFDRQSLRSNGTHLYKKTSIIVSIDGLRADYLDRGLTPHLLAISKDGLRAKSMQPVFPTLTFPNHWALMTGLYAESHGIVANNFWDPHSGVEFHYNKIESCWNSSWWFGEPMWETAERAGIVTANLMWPGPPTTSTGASSTYFIPWKASSLISLLQYSSLIAHLQDKVSLKWKHDQIMSWIDMPIHERPQFIMAYEPSLDQAGHLKGPTSDLVNKVLGQVDQFAKDLHDSIEARNLTDIVDIVFVSDHGMTDTSHPELIYIDDILGDGFGMIEHEDGWPAMGLRFSANANVSHYLNILREAAQLSNGKFDVYTHDTMPERWHFANSERIAPLYVVPRIGYALTNRLENGAGMSKGNHGYDNADASMHAMFVAHGPFASVLKTIHASSASTPSMLSHFLPRPNKGWHSTSDNTYVMDTFENVEIYNLMMKLLGIEEHAAPTNGTAGFWDKYF
ncbi:Phosphodiest-domain-containing protein [Cristinia sonorae]|uniref:Phosphodiest-domain-containing protein n=1 Tax=Cristinia sonorae TaxID=1940300 RepID=A0A8K0UED9_9AGAR|nr:Phosphodiest-domain-containing protein [Cristinia sonorae]